MFCAAVRSAIPHHIIVACSFATGRVNPEGDAAVNGNICRLRSRSKVVRGLLDNELFPFLRRRIHLSIKACSCSVILVIQHIRENLASWQCIRAKAAARGGNMHALIPILYIQFAKAAALNGKICVCGAILHIQLVNAAALQRNDSAVGHLQIVDITALQRKAPALTPIKEDICNLTDFLAVGNRQMHIVSGLEECAITLNRHLMSVQIDRMRSAANLPCTIRSGIIGIQLQCAAVCQPVGDRSIDRAIRSIVQRRREARAAVLALRAGVVPLQRHAAVGALHDLDIFHVGRRGILHIRAVVRVLERIAGGQQRTCRGAVEVQLCKRTAVQRGRAAFLHIQKPYPARPAGQVKRIIARSYDHIRNLRAAADDQLISRIAVADIKYSVDGLSVAHIQRQRFAVCHIAARVFAAQRCDCAAGRCRFDCEIQAALHIIVNIAVGVICGRAAVLGNDLRRHRLSAGIAGPDAVGLRRARIVGAGGSADRAHAVLFRPVVLRAGEAALTVRSPGGKRMLMRFDDQSHVMLGVVIYGIRVQKALVHGPRLSALVIAAQSKRRALGQIVRQVLALRDLQTVNQRRARFERQSAAAFQPDRRIGDVGLTACRIAADHDRVSLYRHAAALNPDAVASGGSCPSLIERSVFQRHAAAGDGQRDAAPYVRILADIGQPCLSVQVNGKRAARDGDVFRHIPRQLHRAAVRRFRRRVDGRLQRGVLLPAVLRRLSYTADRAISVIPEGVLLISGSPATTIAAFSVGQAVGVGGTLHVMRCCRYRFPTDADHIVLTAIRGDIFLSLVRFRPAVRIAQGAGLRVHIVLDVVLPHMIFALGDGNGGAVGVAGIARRVRVVCPDALHARSDFDSHCPFGIGAVSDGLCALAARFGRHRAAGNVHRHGALVLVAAD